MVDYDFYVETYGSELVPEDVFPSYLRRARQILDRMTFSSIVEVDGAYGQIVRGEFQEFTESELLALKYGICCLMDTLSKLDAVEMKAIAGSADSGNIRSRSSGGESVSYESIKTAYDVAMTDEAKKNALYRDSLLAYITPTAFRINPFYAGWR